MSYLNESAARHSAVEKLKSGGLMTLAEVAAVLGMAPATVHRLPLPSIRMGRLLRYDPRDVERLIETNKEPIAA